MADETTLPPDDFTSDSSHPHSHPAPKQIGPYHILGLVSDAGGMGTIYKAEQRRPILRTVAIKVIKLGFDTKEVIARFDSERQALARMDHPNVAKVLDAGATDTGRPYFVMEFVPGVPITKFCDENKLSIKDRLLLFTQVCDAINHAHTKAIIHRDIKANNVLGFLQDGKPTVKVIDFGIAKALTANRLTEETFYTEQGRIVGTYDSMSPEQAEGSPDIDTRTDVYSLGVLLYELLAGLKPFDQETLAKAADEEVKRIIREVEPGKPSTRLSSCGARATKIAELRHSRLDALTKELRSELEWIPLKAMRKERARRYASALQLAEDIDNYLEGKPLIAGPESRAYRLRKFAGRNWRVVAGSAAMILLFAGGAVLYIHGIRDEERRTAAALVDAQKQRDESERQRRAAQARFDQLRKLANSLLADVDPKIANLSGATTARAVLVKTIRTYLDDLSVAPGGDRSLQLEVAAAYRVVGDVLGNPLKQNLGDRRGALDSYRRSLSICRMLIEADASDPRIRLELSRDLGCISDMNAFDGDMASALAADNESLSLIRKLASEAPHDDPIQRELGWSLIRNSWRTSESGDVDGSLNIAREAERIFADYVQSHAGNFYAQVALAVCKGDIGSILEEKGDASAAVEYFADQLAINQRLADSHPDDYAAHSNLALCLMHAGEISVKAGDFQAALANQQKALAIASTLASADPTNARAQLMFSSAYQRLGDVQSQAGDNDAALDSYQKGVQIVDRLAAADRSSAAAQSESRDAHRRAGSFLSSLAAKAGRPEDRRTRWQQANREYETALSIAQASRKQFTVSAADEAAISELQALIKSCQAAMQNTTSATKPDQTATRAYPSPETPRPLDSESTPTRFAHEEMRPARVAQHARSGDFFVSSLEVSASKSAASGNWIEAERLLREALTIRKMSEPRGSATTRCAGRLAELLDETNRPAEADAFRKQYGLPDPTTRPTTSPATTRSIQQP